MKIEVLDNSNINSRAYQEILSVVTGKAHPVLGLATGTTPIGLYQLMVNGYQQGVSYKHVSTYNLDEYVGIDGGNVNSYRYFMNHHLFDHIDIDKDNTHVPCGVGDLTEQCNNYNNMLSQQPIDIQILGIGVNGHIAFNEPNTPMDSTTHVVALTDSTIKANARLFAHEQLVPQQAITMGLANIMNAKKIVVLATGQGKAQAVKDMVQGKVSVACPASILQNHPDVLLLCDKQAAMLLD